MQRFSEFSALRGWFDASRCRPSEDLNITSSGGETRFRSPAMDVVANDASVRWHLDDRKLTLVFGRPRLGDQWAEPSALQAALFTAPTPAWHRLHGRHALVHLDLTAGTAVLVTDRFAVFPLCFTYSPERLAFSDRADCVPSEVRHQIDLQAIYDYLYFHVIPAPRSVFRGVKRVEASTAVTLGRGTLNQLSTWTPRFSPRAVASDPTLAKRFMETLEQAVATETIDGKMGAFLSGGTDSSTVAGMLSRRFGAGVPTFSIGFDASGYDEMAYARLAASHFKTEHHEYYVTPADLCAAIPRVAAAYDQPFGNSSAVPAFYCARLAQRHGVVRMLAGDGGDELFGGNTRYPKQKVFAAYERVPAGLRHAIEPILALPAVARFPILRKVASYVSQAKVPMPARTETYNLLERFGARNVLAEKLRASVDPQLPAALQAAVYERHADASFVDRMLAFDWRFTLTDNDLPKVVGTAALAGVQVGFPMLDDALVDLSLELGHEDKVRGVRLRHFFKSALSEFLPPEIISKKKHGFGLPVGPWLVQDADFRALARTSLDALVARNVIQPSLVTDLFSTRLQEHPGYYGEMVWVLMMLEQWLATNADSFAVD